MHLTSSENTWAKVIGLASEISVLRRLCRSSDGQCCFSGRVAVEGVCVVSVIICSSGCQCCFSGLAVAQIVSVVSAAMLYLRRSVLF